MTEERWTPGPWEWDGDPSNYDPENEAPWLIGPDERPVLSGEISVANIANAHLIAAAPDLYAACQLALDSDDRGVRDVLRAALAKARGE